MTQLAAPLDPPRALALPNTRRALRHRLTTLGTRGPVLVLQHGFGTDQDVWRHVVPLLEDHCRLVLMDLAGAGPNAAQTFDSERYGSIEAFADDLLLILEELGLSDCTYIGASVGAIIGMLAAVERPQLFRRLICIGASARYLNEPGYTGGFTQADLDAVYTAMSHDYHGWVSGFVPHFMSTSALNPAALDFMESLKTLRPDIALSTVRAIFQSDFRAFLPLLRTPTVLLQTSNDPAVPLAAAEYLRDHIPNATLEILPVEGHFPHLSAPALIAEALLRNLDF